MQLGNLSDRNKLLHTEQINLIVDEAVEDSLLMAVQKDTTESDEKPRVDLEFLQNKLVEYISLGLSGMSNSNVLDVIRGRVRFIIYMDDEGFYCFRSGEWSEKIKYNSLEHSGIVFQIENYVEELMGDKYKILIPQNEGDDYRNSIYPYSLIAFYEEPGGFYCLGGATVVKS